MKLWEISNKIKDFESKTLLDTQSIKQGTLKSTITKDRRSYNALMLPKAEKNVE